MTPQAFRYLVFGYAGGLLAGFNSLSDAVHWKRASGFPSWEIRDARSGDMVG
jgi:hypothetical protein